LKGQVALVTGASRGVGKRIALQLAEEGATLVLAARTVKAGEGAYPGSIEETAVEARRRGGEAMPVRCDLTVVQDTEDLCRTALDRFGRVDILVNNAFYNNPPTTCSSIPTSIPGTSVGWGMFCHRSSRARCCCPG